MSQKRVILSADRADQIGKYVSKLRELYGEGYYAEEGLIYTKITHGSSVHSFIDKRNGNILKAASYRAPQPNAVRGSIYMDDFGMHVVNEYGVNYLR